MLLGLGPNGGYPSLPLGLAQITRSFFCFFWYHITGSEDRCDSHLYFRYIVFYFLNKLNHINFNKIFLVSYNSYVCSMLLELFKIFFVWKFIKIYFFIFLNLFLKPTQSKIIKINIFKIKNKKLSNY